ncbi:CHAT domain-containing protein [Dactylosporangium sp. AC04546]|uniref:CHAT domain-containing protein n=1 Tax=Dactylosporangium sp. AC04546 TaxID=2862460 RepID=UPI001EE0C955|nr:CHAT domain-containing protein [Dactylosporangium sp. AC04546]WVK86299.1 CHAT domain-containing protein [Dactylosporangium sp. AC04546]
MNGSAHYQLSLDVRVAESRVRSTVTLDGEVLCERDEPLPFGRDEVWTLIDRPDAAERLGRLGQRLSAALFDAETLDHLTTIVTDGALVDVVVTGDGPAHELPYELIRLTDQRVLAAVEGVRFTRAVAGVETAVQPPAPGPLKILVAVGAPEHTANVALDVEAEMQAIMSVVDGLRRVEVTILEVAGPQEIAAALRRDAYHVLHLSAHGSPHGVELEDRDGNAVQVGAEDLVRVLRRGGRPLPLIVLSSCDGAADASTGLAVTLLRHGAERVIAMQTSVSDRYATGLLTRVYRALAEQNLPVAAALADARAALFDEPGRPEYAVATLFAAGDGPLWNTDADPVPLENPTDAPSGTGVRELALGDLVGRRALLRTVLRTLRDDLPPAAGSALVNGVVLTGVAGIGKTALAGRALNRLREDDDDPWEIVVHTADDVPALAEELRSRRVLLLFDDFERHLTVGGEAFHDPGFADAFAALCKAAERGKILVTSRHPLPCDVPLLRVEVPRMGDAELGRLLLRLPALRDLDPDDRATVLETVGGHPRLVEFVDALLHGEGGRARLPEVTERLRALARRERIALARSAADAPAAADAARQAVTLAARDMLVEELVGLLDEAERETLLQAAVVRIPLTATDLALALQSDPDGTAGADLAAHLVRLRSLTLAAAHGDGVLVEPWVRAALAGLQGDRLADRRRRAAAMCAQVFDAGRADFGTLTEAVHHLRVLDALDELAAFAERVLPRLDGDATVALFLDPVTSALPEDHPAFAGLAGRERDALEALGRTADAAALGDLVIACHRAAARVAPSTAAGKEPSTATAVEPSTAAGEETSTAAVEPSVAAAVELSGALDVQGRLLRRLGRTGDARRCYAEALDVDERLSAGDPAEGPLRRNVGLSHGRLAQLALDCGDLDDARASGEAALDIHRALAEAFAETAVLQVDLANALGVLAAVHRAQGDPATARELTEQALELWRRLTAAASEEASSLQDELAGSVGALADLVRAEGTDPARARELTLEAAGIIEGLAEAEPDSIARKRQLLSSYWRLADMDVEAGDLACAGNHVAAGLSLAERLAGVDEDSVDAWRDLAEALRRTAGHAAAGGHPEEVRGNLERALEIAERLVHRFPRAADRHRELAAAAERLGDWLRETGDHVTARVLFRQAVAASRRRAALDPHDAGAPLAEAALHARVAELDLAAGHDGRARQRGRRAVAVIARSEG